MFARGMEEPGEQCTVVFSHNCKLLRNRLVAGRGERGGGVGTREEVFMERPLETNMGPSLADVLFKAVSEPTNR